MRPAPGSEFSLLTVWDVATGERRFDAVRIPYRASSMAISDDGATVVVSGGRWGRVQVRDGATGELLREIGRLPRPEDAYLASATAAVAFTPDGDLAIGSLVGPIRVVDPHTGAELRRFDSPQETSNFDVFFTRDGTEMVTVGSRGMMRFDVASGEPLWLEPQPVPFCPTWAYAERIGALLCGDPSGQVTAFDVATGQEVGRRFDSQLGGVCSLAVSADGTRVAEVSSCYGEATIVEWRLDGGGPISRLVVDTRGEHHVRSFGFAGDADALVTEFIAAGDSAPVTHVIDASSGEIIARLPGNPPRCSRRTTHGAPSAYFPDDGTVGWYDIEQRTRVGPGVELDHEFGYWQRATVASSSRRSTTRSMASCSRVSISTPGSSSRRRSTGGGSSGASLPSDRTRSTWRSKHWNDDPVYQVQRRDIDTGAVLASAPGFSSVAAGGGIVVASTVDGRIFELDPTSLEPIGVPFPGINGPDQTHSVSTTLGQRLMVLGNDETLRFYDIATRTQLGDAIDLAYADRAPRHAVNVDDGCAAPSCAATGCRPPPSPDRGSSSGISTRRTGSKRPASWPAATSPETSGSNTSGTSPPITGPVQLTPTAPPSDPQVLETSSTTSKPSSSAPVDTGLLSGASAWAWPFPKAWLDTQAWKASSLSQRVYTK